MGSLGDTVVALPCFHKLAVAFPNAERYVLTNIPVSAKAAALELILGQSGLIHGVVDYPLKLRSVKEMWSLSRRLVALSNFSGSAKIFTSEHSTTDSLSSDVHDKDGSYDIRFCAATPIPGTASEREKNVHEMIAAVALLKGRLPNVKYEIIGGGPLRPELEALAEKLGVADSVKFLGQVGDNELQEAYGRASVFAMPSNKEGFGIVYLEAWQFGRPVICSVHGAASEIVADGVDGFVVDPADVKALADRLYTLLTQPDLAKAMGERGRLKVEQKYLNANFRVHLDKILDEVQVDSATPKHAAARSSQLKL
jgi:glycosyltransferase involved in cell wall biosynthesis